MRDKTCLDTKRCPSLSAFISHTARAPIHPIKNWMFQPADVPRQPPEGNLSLFVFVLYLLNDKDDDNFSLNVILSANFLIYFDFIKFIWALSHGTLFVMLGCLVVSRSSVTGVPPILLKLERSNTIVHLIVWNQHNNRKIPTLFDPSSLRATFAVTPCYIFHDISHAIHHLLSSRQQLLFFVSMWPPCESFFEITAVARAALCLWNDSGTFHCSLIHLVVFHNFHRNMNK